MQIPSLRGSSLSLWGPLANGAALEEAIMLIGSGLGSIKQRVHEPIIQILEMLYSFVKRKRKIRSDHNFAHFMTAGTKIDTGLESRLTSWGQFQYKDHPQI